jgi:predicted  nucleic acid-binding Zn-ribbon protein
MDEEVRALITEGFQETRRQFENVARQFDDVRQELGDMRQELGDMRQQLGVVVEHMEGRFAQVAEAFVVINQRLTLTAAEIREEMRAGFSETNALIRNLHANHERRIRALEENQT